MITAECSPYWPTCVPDRGDRLLAGAHVSLARTSGSIAARADANGAPIAVTAYSRTISAAKRIGSRPPSGREESWCVGQQWQRWSLREF